MQNRYGEATDELKQDNEIRRRRYLKGNFKVEKPSKTTDTFWRTTKHEIGKFVSRTVPDSPGTVLGPSRAVRDTVFLIFRVNPRFICLLRQV